MPWRWTQSLASSRRSSLPSSQVLCLRTRCCGVMNLRCLETAGLLYWAFEVHMESFMAISRAPVFRFARRFSRSPRLLVLTSLDELASRLSVRSKVITHDSHPRHSRESQGSMTQLRIAKNTKYLPFSSQAVIKTQTPG